MQSSASYKQDTWVPKVDHARRVVIFLCNLTTDSFRFAKSTLLCHAKTVDLYRREFQPEQKGIIGIVFVSAIPSCGKANQ